MSSKVYISVNTDVAYPLRGWLDNIHSSIRCQWKTWNIVNTVEKSTGKKCKISYQPSKKKKEKKIGQKEKSEDITPPRLKATVLYIIEYMWHCYICRLKMKIITISSLESLEIIDKRKWYLIMSFKHSVLSYTEVQHSIWLVYNLWNH